MLIPKFALAPQFSSAYTAVSKTSNLRIYACIFLGPWHPSKVENLKPDHRFLHLFTKPFCFLTIPELFHRRQQSHIPKFGNWDGDNVPYTAYFENARRDRTGSLMIKPNDPEAFKTMSRGGSRKMDDSDTVKASPASNGHRRSGSISRHRSRGSHGSFTAESAASEKISHTKRSMPKENSFVGSFSSTTSSIRRNKSRSYSSNDYNNKNNDEAVTVIPKFGDWDERDAKSGEGFTMVFDQIKGERQNALGHYPNGYVQSRLATSSNIQNQYGRPTSRISKYCCCLFSSESK
ncbi:hypothetical protein L6164_035969 [Bauhinia variegata]|uniref:Uncharacterized protein n=1 Tax=Bauhinia variegata TaxID=167791 RepID=A0ACB9KFP8_BAUVA|nr:hypothetical protein L6164_035969 [Bauhinia variegata]